MKLFQNQSSALKMALLAAIPFLGMWLYLKVEPIRPTPLPAPAAVAVDTAAWYNPFSWGRDHAANLAANEAAMRQTQALSAARAEDAYTFTGVLMTLGLVAAGFAVVAKFAEVRMVQHPQIEEAAARLEGAAKRGVIGERREASKRNFRAPAEVEEADPSLIST